MKMKAQDARKKYVVRLEPAERERLRALVRGGKAAAYKIRHANILLAVDEAPGARMRNSTGSTDCSTASRPIRT